MGEYKEPMFLKKRRPYIFLAFLVISGPVYAADYPWSVLFYRGFESSTSLGQLLAFNYKPTHTALYSAEVGYALSAENPIQKFFEPIFSRIELSGNVSYLTGGNNPHNIYQFNPFIMFRYTKFPWNAYLNTTVAIGEGISYSTRIPAIEVAESQNAKRLLNFLVVEATFALPKYPRWQMMVRIHHRSGAFGLYGAGNTGSNIPSIGIRYLFD